MNLLKILSISLCSLTLCSVWGLQQANDAASQAIREELSAPFCYFRAPTEQIGFEGSPNATVVTYDGAFISAYGQLSFYAGAPGNLKPISKRVKTLLNNYLPVIQFSFERDGLKYSFEAFAAPIGMDPKNNLITFIQCRVSNPGKKRVMGDFAANFGDIASDLNADPEYSWFKQQRQALKGALDAQRSSTWHSARFMNEAQFNKQRSKQDWRPGMAVQGGHLVMVAPQQNSNPNQMYVGMAGKESAVEYALNLAPHEHKLFRFKVPAVPVDLTRKSAVKDVLSASYDAYRAKTIAFWKAEVKKADRFTVDEPKVLNTFRTSLVNDLTATEINSDGQIYQRVNKIHYDYMWIRDSSFFVRTYDMLGLHDLARQVLHDFVVWKDGKAVSFFKPGAPQPPGARLSVQDDYWGQVLWAVGAHCRMTNDREFLASIYPLLSAHIDEFVAKCAKDPRGLWPVAGPYDNEAIDGHYTGHSFWALLGLKYAVWMANEMHAKADADKWQAIHDGYEKNFLSQLRDLASHSEGYIPPGMDSVTAGNDWDNASGGLYPFEVLAENDPLAKATLKMVRDFNYQEGIVTYGGNAWVAKGLKEQGKTGDRGYLHHYETFYVTESNTMLGEQKKVVEDLYSILAHTGSTNSGFEFGIPAWSTRDPQDNFTPHGWFAARYMSQIRDALVREEGNDLHLMSVLAPKWVEPGKQVKVTSAPTFFGSVGYKLNCRSTGATLLLDTHWTRPPAKLHIHTPWFMSVSSATVDGKLATVSNGELVLSPNIRRVEFKWRAIEKPNLSYEEAVRIFLEKFYRRPAGTNYDFLFPVDGS